MLRKLNFTERARIPRSNVHISLRRGPDGVLVFDPTISLEDLDQSNDARVFVEAFHGTSFMRFDFGTVGALTVPADRRLTDIDSSSIRFRIKVVGTTEQPHRIVAVADDIRVTENAPHEGTQIPLLPVQFSPTLGQQAWRVAFEADTPVLELNNQIDGIQKLAKEDGLFFALVYPAAIREILTRILVIERHGAFDEADEWWSLWLHWASRYAPDPRPEEPDDAARWIDGVVGAFCSRHQVVGQMNASRKAEE